MAKSENFYHFDEETEEKYLANLISDTATRHFILCAAILAGIIIFLLIPAINNTKMAVTNKTRNVTNFVELSEQVGTKNYVAFSGSAFDAGVFLTWENTDYAVIFTLFDGNIVPIVLTKNVYSSIRPIPSDLPLEGRVAVPPEEFVTAIDEALGEMNIVSSFILEYGKYPGVPYQTLIYTLIFTLIALYMVILTLRRVLNTDKIPTNRWLDSLDFDARAEFDHDRLTMQVSEFGDLMISPRFVVWARSFSVKIAMLEDVAWLYNEKYYNRVLLIPLNHFFRASITFFNKKQWKVKFKKKERELVDSAVEYAKKLAPWIKTIGSSKVVREWEQDPKIFLSAIKKQKQNFLNGIEEFSPEDIDK